MQFEFAILDWIQENIRCGFLDAVVPVFTKLGDKGIIWIVLSIVLICTKKYRPYGIMMIISIAAGFLIGNVCLKHIVARPRPCWVNKDVDMLVNVPSDYSFPSGHTHASAEGATVAMYADKKLGICAIVVAVLIALSRLYLYVHYPTDVLGGAILGVGIGMTTVYFYRKKFMEQ